MVEQLVNVRLLAPLQVLLEVSHCLGHFKAVCLQKAGEVGAVKEQLLDLIEHFLLVDALNELIKFFKLI